MRGAIDDAEPGRRRRSEGLERTMLALRDARDARDVLAIVARGLARDFRRPCTAFEYRNSAFRSIDADGDAAGGMLEPGTIDVENLRVRVVVARPADDLFAIVADGKFLALFVLTRGAPLGDEDVAYLRALGSHVGLALGNAYAFDQLRRYAAEGAALTEAARTILGFTQLEPLAASLCRLALRMTQADRTCIYANRDGELVRIAFAAARGGTEPPARVPLFDTDTPGALAAALGSQPLNVSRLKLTRDERGDQQIGFLLVSRATPFERYESRMVETLNSLAALAIRNVDLYEQTSRANAALAETNAFKDDLMAMFAHDFRGPLTVISGFSELLFDANDPDVRRSAQTIVDQTRRLAKLSEDALALAATQSSGFSLNREVADITEFVRSIVDPMDRDGRVALEAPGRPVEVAFDRSRLRHVVDNVVGNALKYSSGAVVVGIMARGAEVTISVSDRGIGFPPADAEKIFSRYGRAANARSRGIAGSGVGLYIAKKIVEIHGGRLTADSVENEGSTFTIALPR